MKKILVFTLLFILVIQFTAFAGSYKVTIKRELGESGETVQKVIAEGTLSEEEFNAGDQITVRILPSSKNVNSAVLSDYYVIGQTNIKEDGSWYFEKRLPSNTGDTFVYLVSDKVKFDNIPLKIPAVSAIDDLVSKLNLGTITNEEVVGSIAQDNENLLFDVAVFNSLTNKTTVIDNMKLKLSNAFNAENIYEEFDRFTLLEALKAGNVDGKTILDNYERVLKLKDRKEYQLFKTLSETGKEKVYSLVNNNTYEDYNKIYEKYFESVILTSVKEVVSYVNIFDILDDYKTELNIISYVDTLNSSEVIKDTVLLYIMNNKNNINSLSDLVSYIDYGILNHVAIRQSYQQPAPPPVVGGGGGGDTYKTDETLQPDNYINTDVDVKYGFSDISGYSWAEKAILNLYNNGIIKGKETDKFYPQDFVTRAEFVKMITMSMGIYDENVENVFSDTLGHWSEKYVASAFKNGYVNGISDVSFAPDNNITRQDAVVILYRILNIIAKADKVEDLTGYVFSDDNLVADYARGSVIMMNAYGIVNGYEDNTFKPLNNLTRAEAAVVVDKFLNYIQ